MDQDPLVGFKIGVVEKSLPSCQGGEWNSSSLRVVEGLRLWGKIGGMYCNILCIRAIPAKRGETVHSFPDPNFCISIVSDSLHHS